MDIFTHTENLIIKKLRIARKTGDLEAETGKDSKKPDIGRVVESYFNLPNEYSSSIILTDSHFILTDRTSADMSFKTEYKNIEFLWKQRSRNKGRSSLASGGVTDTGKIPMFFSDTGDGEAARRPGKPSLVLDEIERLPRGKRCEGALASSVQSEQRTTASSGTVHAHTCNLL